MDNTTFTNVGGHQQALKQQQARRKQMRIRQYTQQQLQHEAKIERMKWSAEHGMAGNKMKSTKVLVLRRQPELSSEQVGTMPENAFVHILEMAKPNEEGIRRALVQDTWGKNSGWCTVVDADGEANLVPADEPIVKPGHGGGMSWDVVPDDGARGGWMTRGFQGEMWAREHYPKHDQIPKQQEKDQRRTMQLNQFQQQQRRQKTEQAAGRRSNVKRVERHGGTPAAGRARPSAATAFRAARV